jgi:hypothetical protein
VLDDVLSNPEEYRKQALSGEFHSVSFGVTFHGIQAPPTSEFAMQFQEKVPRIQSCADIPEKKSARTSGTEFHSQRCGNGRCDRHPLLESRTAERGWNKFLEAIRQQFMHDQTVQQSSTAPWFSQPTFRIHGLSMRTMATEIQQD